MAPQCPFSWQSQLLLLPHTGWFPFRPQGMYMVHQSLSADIFYCLDSVNHYSALLCSCSLPYNKSRKCEYGLKGTGLVELTPVLLCRISTSRYCQLCLHYMSLQASAVPLGLSHICCIFCTASPSLPCTARCWGHQGYIHQQCVLPCNHPHSSV